MEIREDNNPVRAGKLPERKKKIRLEALRMRDSLTTEQRRDYSRRIVNQLTSLPCYREAEVVLTYISFRSEVDTIPLLERAFADGKAVFAPKVAEGKMEFYRIFSVKDLAAGYRGIPEPKGGLPYADWSGQGNVLICMPGAAFDRERHRIGYGGGFYDRYLEGLFHDGKTGIGQGCQQRRPFTAALAFSCQIFEKIPWETHDIRPERLVTETEIL